MSRIHFALRSGNSSFYQTFDKILQCSLYSTLDSPAVSVWADILISSPVSDFCFAQMWQDNQLLWEGKIDLLQVSENHSGTILHLEGRDHGGALLDNESQPASLWNANLTTMFSWHISGYGFSLYSNHKSSVLPSFTIAKGMSEWDVFSRFCNYLTGFSPYLSNHTVYASKPIWKEQLLLSNQNSSGIRYTKMTHTQEPYQILSELVVQDQEGYYSSLVKNPDSPFWETARRRYVTPPSEFAQIPTKNAYQRIRQSMYQSESWNVTLLGFPSVFLGMGISLEQQGIRKRGLIIENYTHILNENGPLTHLTLRDETYW